MDLEQHAAAAGRLMISCRILHAAGDTMGSAEMVWGAAIQAVHALHYRDRNRHPHNVRALERIIAAVQLPRSGAERLSLELAATLILHNHFYTGLLSREVLIAQIELGIDFVNEVLRLSLAPPARS